MLVALALLACGPPATTPGPSPAPPAPPPLARHRLDPLAAPEGEARLTAQAAPALWVEDRRFPLSFHPLVRQGDVLDGPPFGALLDQHARPIVSEGSPRSCGSADYNALITVEDAPLLLTHLECRPAALQVTRLDLVDGVPRARWSRPAHPEGTRGLSNLCAGDLAPWGALLSGEEYEPDARRIGPDGRIPGDRFAWHRQGDFLGDPAKVDPYDHGWIVETRAINAEGRLSVSKRYALGRFSHELALLLPDQRTLILSDDGNDGALFLFVADAAGDLSAGALYAARWQQTGDPTVPAPLAWIPLGPTDEAALTDRLGKKQLRFDQLFDATDPVEGACPEGQRRVQSMTGEECLALRPGAEPLAAMLESRRLAALRGATTELRKAEGLAWDDKRGVAYLAISEIGAGMVAEPGRALDHLALDPNPCGAVFALEALSGGVVDTTGALIPGDRVPTRIRAALAGRAEGEACAVDGIANPDNLGVIPEAGWVLVAEDSKRHVNNALWAWDPGSGELHRLFTAPAGGEVTGMSWVPDLGGFGWVPLSVQHPFDPAPAGLDGDKRSFVGFLGPFPGPGAW